MPKTDQKSFWFVVTLTAFASLSGIVKIGYSLVTGGGASKDWLVSCVMIALLAAGTCVAIFCLVRCYFIRVTHEGIQFASTKILWDQIIAVRAQHPTQPDFSRIEISTEQRKFMIYPRVFTKSTDFYAFLRNRIPWMARDPDSIDGTGLMTWIR